MLTSAVCSIMELRLSSYPTVSIVLRIRLTSMIHRNFRNVLLEKDGEDQLDRSFER